MSNDKESYYMVSGEQALLLLAELKETQEVSSYLLRHFIETTVVSEWETSPVPQLADLYSGSRACASLLKSLMEAPTPPEFREKVTEGAFCISAMQYLEFVTMVEALRALKTEASRNNNVSFEVH